LQRAIFISYRRSDSEGESGRLSDVLSHRFSEQAVFMDVDAIRPGRDFRVAIEESIQGCAVLLVVIGPDWLEARGTTGQRRLNEANDYVRLEIAAALGRDIPVIPVLIRGARMPVAEELPKEISELAYRNGVTLTHSRWKSDLQVLIQALEPYMAHQAVVGHGGAAASLPPGPSARMKQARSAVVVPPAHPAPVAPAASGWGPAAVPGVSAPAAQAALPREAVEAVAKLLANYIGPIAEVVVRRAAGRSSSMKELGAMVAAEIEAPSERSRFLAQMPK
jgi:hypothetical protein